MGWSRSYRDPQITDRIQARPTCCCAARFDTPPMAAIRQRLEPAHLAFLREHVDEILIAGGTRDLPGGPYVGGLWVLSRG